MRGIRHVGILMFSCLLMTAVGAETESTKKPYVLPTFSDENADFHTPIPPLQKAKPIDAEALFQRVTACYPSTSKFDLSVKLKARYGIQDDSVSEISDLGKYYFGIVAEMPILDGSEATDRQRKREYDRRKDTSAAVAKFMQAIAKRNQLERQIGLFTALEQRAQVRVQLGMIGVSEQVGYLQSVIKAQEQLEAAKAEILQTRLMLSGQCEADKVEAMNAHLRDLAETAGEVVE